VKPVVKKLVEHGRRRFNAPKKPFQFTSDADADKLLNDLSGQSVTPRADIGWQHAFNRLTPFDTVAFEGNGEGFSVAGAPLDKDAAALQGGIDIAITPQAVVSLTYDGTFSSKVTDNTLRGGFIWKF